MSRTASIICVFLLSTISLVTAANFRPLVRFNRDECYNLTLKLIDNHTLHADDDHVFFRDDSGHLMVHPNNVTLTLPGCRKVCSSKQGWYTDIGPRLSVWLIPILLLISNIDLSPLDKRRFLAIIHFLGDPIDSFWSLIDKIGAWDRCYSIAEQHDAPCERRNRVKATILAGFEEIRGPEFRFQEDSDTLIKSSLNREDKFREWRQTARELADSRTNEYLRTCLAIVLYIYQVIAAFVGKLGGGNTSPPGGRIGTAMFISWLVPAVLLSNNIGGFTSRRTCFSILSRFAERIDNYQIDSPPRDAILFPRCSDLVPTSSTEYFESLSWSGAIYTFRPWKKQYERNWYRAALIIALSISPVCIGMIAAFSIIWNISPQGFNCRHLWLIGIFFAWVISAFITWLSYSRFASGKHHWRFILIKDALIALSSILIIFLSSCGLFNSCFCWSGFYGYHGRAHVPLNVNSFYELNDRTKYPAIVSACVFAQLLVFVIIAIIWRHGLKLMRWSERARRVEWESTNRCCICQPANGPFSWILLQWWCPPSLRRWIENRRRRLDGAHMCCQCVIIELVAIPHGNGQLGGVNGQLGVGVNGQLGGGGNGELGDGVRQRKTW
jgi:hypothetical protein